MPVKVLDCRHQECQSLARASASFAQDVTASAIGEFKSTCTPKAGKQNVEGFTLRVQPERASGIAPD